MNQSMEEHEAILAAAGGSFADVVDDGIGVASWTAGTVKGPKQSPSPSTV